MSAKAQASAGEALAGLLFDGMTIMPEKRIERRRRGRKAAGEGLMSIRWKFRPLISLADLADVRLHGDNCAVVHGCDICTCGAVMAGVCAESFQCSEIAAEDMDSHRTREDL